MPELNPGRSYRMALTLLAVGSVLLLVGFALPWASVRLPLATGVDTATRTQELIGRDLFPGAAASGWVCLAGLAGVLATRSWGRVVVGAIVTLAGLVGAGVAFAYALAPSMFVTDAVSALTGPQVPVSSSATGWWAMCLLGGVLGAVSGAWTAVRGRRWPSLGRRYERATRGAPAESAWEAMDKGVDPTDDLVE